MNLEKMLKSKIHRKVVLFFHENQTSIDTPRGIATWIREDRLRVLRALEDLAKEEILVAHRATSTTGYSYTRNSRLIAKINRLLNKKSS
ncbi:MAG: hypothetical protein PHP46_02285 [Candidatus Omnitrophica bacterium]|nr:hypothetical protein [Candidatus Omnitrophota bacterium]